MRLLQIENIIVSTKPSVLIIAGETSGDAHGAKLAKELPSNIQLFAMGSNNLQDAGATLLVNSRDLGVVGFFEIFKVLKKILSAYRLISSFIKTQKPDVVILIDYPGFNLRIAKIAKKSGCKVLYYISPQLWAWKQGRVNIIKNTVDEMVVILPFEIEFYRQHGIQAHYVTHPLVEDLKHIPDRDASRKQSNYTEDAKIIGLLPGSRQHEIEKHLPILISSAHELKKRYPSATFLLPLAPSISKEWVQKYFGDLSISITHDLYPTLCACDLVIATSGTVTLQAGLTHTPMIVIYKSSFISYSIAKLLVKVKYICLCNIIAEKEIVKELIQDQASVNNIVAEASKILEDTQYRDEMRLNLKKMSDILEHFPSQYSLTEITQRLLSKSSLISSKLQEEVSS